MRHRIPTSPVTMSHHRSAAIRAGKQGSLSQEPAATRPVASPIFCLHRMHRLAVGDKIEWEQVELELNIKASNK